MSDFSEITSVNSKLANIHLIRTGLTSWFQICMTLQSISLIWPLLVEKMVKVDRFWSFQLVCSAHTTYSHHSNRLDQLIPIFYIILCVYSDLTTNGRIQWSELTTCGHILELNQNLRYIHIIWIGLTSWFRIFLPFYALTPICPLTVEYSGHSRSPVII